VTGEPPPSLEAAIVNPDLVAPYARVTASFAWTRGFITAGGWYDWLAKLLLEARLLLPDGSRLLGVHASPGTDDGEDCIQAEALPILRSSSRAVMRTLYVRATHISRFIAVSGALNSSISEA
jgi:hypothetical protein